MQLAPTGTGGNSWRRLHIYCSHLPAGEENREQNEVDLTDVCAVFWGDRRALAVCHRTDECAQLSHRGKLPGCSGRSSGKRVPFSFARACLCELTCWINLPQSTSEGQKGHNNEEQIRTSWTDDGQCLHKRFLRLFWRVHNQKVCFF